MHYRHRMARPVFYLIITALFTAGSTVHAAGQNPAPAAPTATTSAANKQEVIARVNKADILAVDLRRAKKVIMSGQSSTHIPPERQKEFDSQVLSQLIAAELLYQAGQKLELKELEKSIDAKIAQGKAGFPSEAEFNDSIKTLEMTNADLRDYTRRDLIITNFIEQTIASKVTVAAEESKAFYDQNLDKFKLGESVRASHILLGVAPDASDEEKGKAKKTAEKLRKELADGASFAQLAKDNSTCPSSQEGGDLGLFGRGRMVPEFEQAAFALKQGQISNVVETQFGFHIIKLTEIKKAETMEFNDVKARIEEYLKDRKTNAAVMAYVTEARKNAVVEISK